MKAAAIILLALASAPVLAQSHMKNGYVKKDGTYVAPSMATNPNDTKLDNYSTKGNVNPYSGKAGTVDPYKVQAPKLKPIKP
jgi:hypothetical protein